MQQLKLWWNQGHGVRSHENTMHYEELAAKFEAVYCLEGVVYDGEEGEFQL